MTLKGISLNLSGVQLSDLFFNHDHPARDKLCKQDYWSDEDMVKALKEDAIEFLKTLDCYGSNDNNYHNYNELAVDLVVDFINRV